MHSVSIEDTTTTLPGAGSPDTGFPVGTEVEVRRRFDRAWARGFEVFDQSDDGYQLRRLSDGAVLPVSFPITEVRISQLASTA